ncbi:NAD(P)H-binding protein [Pararhodobacter aggregans]|uniref:NAD(P)H-binding protein n=1 Tax=Pararhodobacter aggregans TaxID=404875 RepID=UPI003A8D054D
MVDVVMLGASGAVGGAALRALAGMPEVGRVTLLNRREIALPGPKVVQHVIDPGDPGSYRAHLAGHDVALCTLGVGEPSKTPKEVFVRVDRDMPLAFAQACREAGIGHFSLLSAVGVSAGSRFLYVRTKGQLEDGLRALGFARLALFHPSMILTPENRYGPMQGVLLAVWPWLTPLLAGPLRKYRGVRVADLGRAMAVEAARGGSGEAVLEWDDFQTLT